MFLGHFQRYIKLPVFMTLLTTRPVSFPLPEPKWLPRFMRIDIWAVNILEPHLMSVSVRVNTFLAEDRCWSCLHWGCGALASPPHPLQQLCSSWGSEGKGKAPSWLAELWVFANQLLQGPEFCQQQGGIATGKALPFSKPMKSCSSCGAGD